VSDFIAEIVHTSIQDIGRSIGDPMLIEYFTDSRKTTDWIMVTINREHVPLAQ